MCFSASVSQLAETNCYRGLYMPPPTSDSINSGSEIDYIGKCHDERDRHTTTNGKFTILTRSEGTGFLVGRLEV
jgi:hypothetical protein